jgi:RNA polymerase sigma-70 factor, ECF subfamily
MRSERKRFDASEPRPVTVLRRAPASDAELVAAVRAGDRPSALELYRRYAADAERMIVRICGFVPEHSDLLHDVFVRVLEGIQSLRDPSVVRSWIMGIAVRRAYEFLRGRKRVPAPLEFDVADRDRDVDGALAVRRAYQLLDRLDHDDRVAFALRRIEGLELSEIVEACGVSLATVKRRIARAEQTFTEMARADSVLSSRLDRRPR